MITTLDWPADQLDQVERSFLDNIRQHGWVRTAALAEESKPGFSFTSGFWVSSDHPELMIFNISDDVVHELLWVQYRSANAARPLPIGKRTDAVFSNLPPYAFRIAKRHFADYLGWSRWLYRGNDFECLQIVWPDRAGTFPWEAGFDEGFAFDQIDLTEHGWAAEVAD